MERPVLYFSFYFSASTNFHYARLIIGNQSTLTISEITWGYILMKEVIFVLVAVRKPRRPQPKIVQKAATSNEFDLDPTLLATSEDVSVKWAKKEVKLHGISKCY